MAKTTAIRAPTTDPVNHQIVLRQLKEASETASRLRGNARDSFAQVGELLDAGIVRFVDGKLVAPSPSSLPPTVVPSTRKVATTGSLQGGGYLSSDLTLELAGDVGSPGNGFYYGTNSSGTKGFFALPIAPNAPFTKGALWVASSGAVTTPSNDVVRVMPVAAALQEIIITGVGGPGSAQFDIWYVTSAGYPASSANSICGGTYPTITSGNRVSVTNFGTYTTTSFAQDGYLVFHLISSSNFTSVSIEARLQ